MSRRFTEAEVVEVWDRRQADELTRSIARRFGRNGSSIRRLFEEAGGVRPALRRRGCVRVESPAVVIDMCGLSILVKARACAGLRVRADVASAEVGELGVGMVFDCECGYELQWAPGTTSLQDVDFSPVGAG